MAAAALTLLAPGLVCASELSGIGTLASEYIYRGQAMSDHSPALSFGLDYEHGSGFFGGVWASSIDLESPFGSRDVEVDYYFGYRVDAAAPLSLSALLMQYTYPGNSGPVDYEYSELMLSATLLERYTLEFAYSDDVYGLGAPGRHWELRGEWPVATYWVLGAGAGINDLNLFGSKSYAHWDAGLSTRFSYLTVDFRWHDNETIYGPFNIWSAGSRFVVSLSAGF